MSNRHTFDVALQGRFSKLWIDGVEMKGVRDIKIDQPLDSLPIITVQFIADKVVTRPEATDLLVTSRA